MSEGSENLAEECSNLITKADRALRAAERNHTAGDYDFASSRAYYASYYAIKAALLSKKVTSSKHSGNISEFNRLFLKTGIFSRKFGKILNQLFQDRQIGDYDSELNISEEEARDDLRGAAELLAVVRSYLVQESLLPRRDD